MGRRQPLDEDVSQRQSVGGLMEITWLPARLIEEQGRLGLTHIPGLYDPLREDLKDMVGCGVTHIVCLVEPEELGWLTPEETLTMRREDVEAFGLDFLSEPIVDYEAPSLPQVTRIVAHIKRALVTGGEVIVHCWAGLGRAGTIAACVLVELGYEAGTAIEELRGARPGAIQSEEQEELIAAFAASMRPLGST